MSRSVPAVVRTWLVTPAAAERHQRRAAAALRRAGLGPADRVAVTLGTSPAVLALTLGALRTGVVPVLLNATLLPAELDDLVADADAAVAVRSQAALDQLLAAGEPGPGADLAPHPLARPMHYTSGTTGAAKGVWSGVLTEAEAAAQFEDEAHLWEPGPGDTLLMASPIYHSVAVRLSTCWLLSGGQVLLMERWDATTAARLLAAADVRVTAMFGVPTHLQRLLALGDLPPLGHVRRLIHAGAPCPEALKRRLLEVFPAGSVWEFYGSTEGQFTVCGPEEWLARPGTVGRARAGRRLSVDGGGQIWCQAPGWARFEYWRDPAKTAAAWQGGAFTVGDLGRLDGDGYLYLDGRRDDLIISGGVNVYPAEVEAVLLEVPDVVEAVVFGRADDRWGQRVCAAVTVAAGLPGWGGGGAVNAAASEAVTEAVMEAVMQHARARLAPFKRPKEVHVVDDLPRTATGKVRRTFVESYLGLG